MPSQVPKEAIFQRSNSNLCKYIGWLRKDPNFRRHNQDVVEATERMIKDIIPQLVKDEIEGLRIRDQEMYLDWVSSAIALVW